jgi:D-lactate dehydrogenase (cytochrome)
MTAYSPITPAIRAELEARLSPGALITEPARLEDYAGDASCLRHLPELVVCAHSVADVQALLTLANTHRFPVTPRGGGSGLAGACLADRGGVVLSTRGLDAIRTIDTTNGLMEVEAGAISLRVREAAAARGLFYPPDPAGMELSTIGGNAATDAGGPACVKYGTTRDYILGLEAVLPDGSLITTGVRTRKGVVGYDLTNLLVGCEAATTGVLCTFASMADAMRAVARVMAEGHLPSAIEFLDYRCLALIGEMLPFVVPGERPSLLIVELDGPAAPIEAEMAEVVAVMTREGATRVLRARDEAERQQIWQVRRQVSLRIHDHAALYLSEDVVVPLSAIATLVDALAAHEARHGVEIFAFGHAGDGNIHLNITSQHPNHQERMDRVAEELLRLVLDLGGTISGEHGIGLAKRPFLPLELTERSIDLQRRIKRLFDPNQILNPGKIFP